MYRWISGVLVGLVALGAVISGCGGGSDSSSTVTKAEFVKQADALCAERQKEWKAALASYNQEVQERNATNKLQVQEEIATDLVEKEMIPAVSKQLEAMEALPAPRAAKSRFRR